MPMFDNITLGLNKESMANCDSYITPRPDIPNITLSKRVNELQNEYKLPALLFSASKNTYKVSFDGKVMDMTNHTFVTKQENSEDKTAVHLNSTDMYDITCSQVSLHYMENLQNVDIAVPYMVRAVLMNNVNKKDFYTNWNEHLF